MKEESLNVYDKPLEICGLNPITGAFRDGCCDTGPGDIGTHTVCAVVDNKFLEFSKSRGNDLTIDYPEYNFKGLMDGDRWCLCASRWVEAYEVGLAPKVVLESTHKKTLEFISIQILEKFKFNK
tara:strand:- start:806 stop:1177 length:372 start_codon:yes stop_codon:yes gene_type:complete